MEDFESPYVVEWSDQQNALVESYLAGSEIENIQKILTEAYSSEYYSLAYFNPESEYYFYNSGAEEHHLYMKKERKTKSFLIQTIGQMTKHLILIRSQFHQIKNI